MFRQNASRDMEYVVFEVKPSETDINATNDAMGKVYDEFATTENVKSFLARNSEKPTVSTGSRLVSFQPSTRTSASLLTTMPPVLLLLSPTIMCSMPRGLWLQPRFLIQPMSRHILLQNGMENKADSLLNLLSKGESFSNLAAAFSADGKGAADGEQGNIGWMTQTYMIPGFESVLTAQTGKPYIVKTQYGTHIVEVTKKTAPVAKKQVAILEGRSRQW